jgi:hypothetical protein
MIILGFLPPCPLSTLRNVTKCDGLEKFRAPLYTNLPLRVSGAKAKSEAIKGGNAGTKGNFIRLPPPIFSQKTLDPSNRKGRLEGTKNGGNRGEIKKKKEKSKGSLS